MLIVIAITVFSLWWWFLRIRDCYWGPERGLYNFTVVTAMLDIGRGDWRQQSRSYSTYLRHFARVLCLDVNMVVFTDARGRLLVDRLRQGRERRTHVMDTVTQLEDLYYYSHRERVQEIMNSPEFKQDNELVSMDYCEATVPEYDIMMWSKLTLMDQALETDPFSTSYFIWLDGGYGHGLNVFPPDGIWRPKHVFQYPDKVSFIQLESPEKYRNVSDRLHKIHTAVFNGAFFGGGKEALVRMYALQKELISDWLARGVADDDQTVYVLLYYREPELFNLIPGDWYDALTALNSHPSQDDTPRHSDQ